MDKPSRLEPTEQRQLVRHAVSSDSMTKEGFRQSHAMGSPSREPFGWERCKIGKLSDAEQECTLRTACYLGPIDESDLTYLHYAVWYWNNRIAHELINRRSDVNAKTKSGYTPLHLAAQAGNVEAMRRLIQSNAQVDAEDKQGNTALGWACSHGHIQAAQELLKAAAPLDADWQKALMFAPEDKRAALELLRRPNPCL